MFDRIKRESGEIFKAGEGRTLKLEEQDATKGYYSCLLKEYFSSCKTSYSNEDIDEKRVSKLQLILEKEEMRVQNQQIKT